MGLTQSAWDESFVNGIYTATCNVAIGLTTDDDAYTKKTPAGLDPSKLWTLYFYSTIAADNTVPIDVWVGWDDQFALSGNHTTVTAGAYGALYSRIMDDAVAAILDNPYIWIMNPYAQEADIVTAAAVGNGLRVKIPIFPYYVFNCNGADLVATTCYWKITQKQSKLGM